MAIRRRVAVVALLVFAVGVPFADGTAFMDLRHLDFGQLCLLVLIPPVVALVLSGISIAPSRTLPHSTRGDVVSVLVGLGSFWSLVVGFGVVGVAAGL